MSGSAKGLPPVPVEFRSPIWAEEVWRFAARSSPRIQAELARKEIEHGLTRLTWRRCSPEGADGTNLSGCRKLYVPLRAEGASDAPFGLIFRLTRTADGLAWVMIAFGERHPANSRSRSVYERAHKRLHGRYP